ncbi:DUF6165 family protein [Acidimicrobiaceae bacterium]|nr:DUF6165 family protein [Acidimicrobiaceae bacterium]|tara:strand:- start:175 stop:564 length:390 start_codon:yes stop_codon:yes gene_type:complete
MPEVNISIGELVDKLSILEIKLNKVADKSKLKNIKKEYDTLSSVSKSIKENNPDEFSILYSELLDVNNQLWEIEDKIRILEKEKKFDSDFIETARNVYIINDERFQIKSKINSLFDSEIIEEKDYEDYK